MLADLSQFMPQRFLPQNEGPLQSIGPQQAPQVDPRQMMELRRRMMDAQGGGGAPMSPLPSRPMPMRAPFSMPDTGEPQTLMPQGPPPPSMRDRFGAGLRAFGSRFGSPQAAPAQPQAAPPLAGVQKFGSALASRRKQGASNLGFGRVPSKG